MRIGVVSDTHNNMKNVARIVELFNVAKVERVIHTGDITQAKTINALANLDAPVYGVFGNNDLERDSLQEAIARHGFTFCEPPFIDVWAERKLIVVHDPVHLEEHLEEQLEAQVHQGYALALHGHTHLYRLETWGERTTIFNPGECAGMMPGHNAVGVVDLISLETELLRF